LGETRAHQNVGFWDAGSDVRTESLFSYVSCEARGPEDHLLRPVRVVAAALDALSPEFEQLYAPIGGR
jgi:hypothetical protein